MTPQTQSSTLVFNLPPNGRRARIEKLHSERGAKLDRIKMQRHMLMSEQAALARDLSELAAGGQEQVVVRALPAYLFLAMVGSSRGESLASLRLPG